MIKRNHGNEKGVTLVEIAIVMVIIGVILAGVLTAQELIANSRVTSTIAQMENLVAAVNTFQNDRGVSPGDMANARSRLQGCAAGTSCGNGNGNRRIDVSVGAVNATGNESGFFFAHLLAGEYLSGYSLRDEASFGQAFPAVPLGGGFMVGDTRAGASTGFEDAELRQGPYLLIVGRLEAVNANTGVLSPAEARRIDLQLDDGRTNTSLVIAQNAANTCRDTTEPEQYAGNQDRQVCVIAYQLPRIN